MRGRQNAPRIWEDHRKGADVSPEQFRVAFGFGGVQFGNYVGGTRRQQDLNRAYDAPMDLAGVLDPPPGALSRGGRLLWRRGRTPQLMGLPHREFSNA